MSFAPLQSFDSQVETLPLNSAALKPGCPTHYYRNVCCQCIHPFTSVEFAQPITKAMNILIISCHRKLCIFSMYPVHTRLGSLYSACTTRTADLCKDISIGLTTFELCLKDHTCNLPPQHVFNCLTPPILTHDDCGQRRRLLSESF